MSDPIADSLLHALGGPSAEALDHLIYVVGAARGGTSVTQAIIGLHDGVIALDGPSSFLNHVWRYRKKVHDRLLRVILWTPTYLHRDEVRESLEGERREAYVRLINHAFADKTLPGLYRLYPVTKALDPAEKRKPASFVAWLDKGNDFWGVDALQQAYPRSHFVFVMRDPRGAVASLAGRAANLRPDTKFQAEAQDVIATAIYWRNLARQILRFARRHPQQSVVMQFEKLTTRPLEMAQGLYEALGLTAIPEDTLRDKLASLAYGSSNDRTDRGTGIRTTPNERWKSVLDPLSVDLIAELCGRSAAALGYDLPEPQRRRGWLGILRLVPGSKNKLRTLAKLVFLAVTDGLPGAALAPRPVKRLAVD